ncbi:MAG TPA: HD domain-containing phosphohydrolase [Solirubrobacteraceae bacterium]|nr:HD domain-containing phosphohydrolase [Solirubrobacteraceae bacterium]
MSRLTELEAENAELQERVETAERYTAETLLRATRLNQVISLLAHQGDLDAVIDRAAVELAELFCADIAVLMLCQDGRLAVEGHCGVRGVDVPAQLPELHELAPLTPEDPVLTGPAAEVSAPAWLSRYGAEHVAWAQLVTGEESLGALLLVRCADAPFEDSDRKELRAIAYRIALAVENGRLNDRVTRRVQQLQRLHQLTTELAGTLELDEIGRRVAETLISVVPVPAASISVRRNGADVKLFDLGTPDSADGATCFALRAGGTVLGSVTVVGTPARGSDEHELLTHILRLAALALDKALLHEQILDQARHDALTGLLGHRVFFETLDACCASGKQFSIVLIDIDDFKQINDTKGHQAGDEALQGVATALRAGVRDGDHVFRVGGEEFCAVLFDADSDDALASAERLRRLVETTVGPPRITVSLGVATFPVHAGTRQDLIAHADAGLYASKRRGKNCATIAGGDDVAEVMPIGSEPALAFLERMAPGAATHGVEVAQLSVEVGRLLGLSDEDVSDLRRAATLHDAGKVGVPDAILNKPGRLDDDEFRVIETHPTVGAQILRSWGVDEKIVVIVAQHHERIDGSGYPAGLSGDAISIEARIIHVTDAYMAMTENRPYRRALPADVALAELIAHRGTQFDPDVVDAMVMLRARRASDKAA